MRILLKIAVIFILTSSSFSIYAQQNEDIVQLTNGQEKKGKVSLVSDDIIKFSYSGEDVLYEIKTSDVLKIIFANGRQETFGDNTAASSQQNVSNSTGGFGSILAVAPFEIGSNDASLTTDMMRRAVQDACVDALRKQGLNVQIQDQRLTNSILAKEGIELIDISHHSPAEIAKILGVNYILLGTYDIENRGTSTIGTGSSTYKEKQDGNTQTGTSIQSNNSISMVNYDTKVQVAVYDATGKQIFSDSKNPFFGGLESYRGALKTLSKRIPLK